MLALTLGHACVNGEGEELICGAFGLGEGNGARSRPTPAGLSVERNAVVACRLDAGLLECSSEAVTQRRRDSDDVLVECVAPRGRGASGRDDGAGLRRLRHAFGLRRLGEAAVVVVGTSVAGDDIGLETGQQYVECRRLEFVESRVDPDCPRWVGLAGTVHTEATQALCERGVSGRDGPRIAERAEVLGGIEAPGGRLAARSGRMAGNVARADRLCGIVEQRGPMSGGDGAQRVRICWVSEQVDRHDRAQPVAVLGGRGDALGIECETVGDHVGEHRLGAESGDCRGCCDERQRRDDHLVARADAESHQREQQCIRSGGATDRVLALADSGERRLELLDFASEHEVTAVEDAAQRGIELRAHGAQSRLEIDQPDAHAAQHTGAAAPGRVRRVRPVPRLELPGLARWGSMTPVNRPPARTSLREPLADAASWRPERAALDLWSLVPGAEPELALLSPDERERDARQRSGAARGPGFGATRSALRRVLARYVGAEPAELEFRYGDHGRPALRAPGELDFNLSHSGARALVAVGYGARFGVDLQRVESDRPIEGLARRFFAPFEQRQLAGLAQAALAQSFFALWCCKEAYLKALGTSISELPSDRFGFELDRASSSARLAESDWAGPGQAALGDWQVVMPEPPDGYAAAVVWAGAPRSVRTFGGSP